MKKLAKSHVNSKENLFKWSSYLHKRLLNPICFSSARKGSSYSINFNAHLMKVNAYRCTKEAFPNKNPFEVASNLA